MYLYDGTSDVDFFYAGTMTHAEISEDPSLADLVSAPCVLYDDGEGRVYRFDRLDVLADRYGIDMTDDAEQTFASVLSAMEETPPDRAEQALQMAESAQQAADEAKTTADEAKATADEAKGAVDDATSAAQTATEAAATAQTAADGAKATADTAAASVNEYMDALLGLNTTDETEATDAE